MRAFFLIALLSASLHAQPEAQIRQTVDRALVPIQRSVQTFVDKRACVSCHHNALAIQTLRMAAGHGIKLQPGLLAVLEAKTFREFNQSEALASAIEGLDFADPTPNQSFLLMAAQSARLIGTDAMRVTAARIASWQQPDGHWATSDFRPPHSSSLFTATASAVMAIKAYGSPADGALLKAREWLASRAPESTEDASFRLMGLAAVGGNGYELERAAQDLTAMQLPSGGWPQLRGYVADAYSTGEAVYALQTAALAKPAQVKGLRFLVTTQAPDGTWRTKTRMLSPATVSPMYFKTGFPYGHDEFLSFAGSCWALQALLTSMPVNFDGSGLFAPPAPLAKPQQAALFGSEAELRAELDSGWNVHYRFGNEETLLMLAAASQREREAKVRLLLARNADVKARSKSGTDALTIAASFRGSAGTLKLLLDAGAEPNLPEGSKVKNSALVFASMSGDLDAVKLLLSKGANPSASSRSNTPLSAAITFGHTDVVKALIDAGASVDLTESTGINLLHWATITNRPRAIPLLVKAGVKVNAMDENGFTSLHYAASIDFGDTEVMDALLAAGADTKQRNYDERTPAQQALRLNHARLGKRLATSAKR